LRFEVVEAIHGDHSDPRTTQEKCAAWKEDDAWPLRSRERGAARTIPPAAGRIASMSIDAELNSFTAHIPTGRKLFYFRALDSIYMENHSSQCQFFDCLGASQHGLFALKKNLGRTTRRASSQKRCANVPVLDTGARGATVTFTSRGVGDILFA
jgi:hypothetical protein